MIRKMPIATVQENEGLATGRLEFAHWLADEEKCPNVDVLADIVVTPGAAVGDHQHVGEAEVYRALKGKAIYNDNGKEVEVTAGDVMVCYNGETHGIKNNSNEDFIFTAIVIKE
ncbi:MAG: cupin domain-containing protein [Christensenellaceae bacterium]